MSIKRLRSCVVKSALAACMFFGAGAANQAMAGESAVGEWNVDSSFGQRAAKAKLAIEKAEDGSLQGTWTSERGEGPITDAKFEDGQLTFSREVTFRNNSYTLKFKGTIEGDTLDGAIITDRGDFKVVGAREVIEEPSAGPIDDDEVKKVGAEMEKKTPAILRSFEGEPLQYPKGNGLRILMTGHSWVAPALKALPDIVEAAGYGDQHIRFHMGGGGKGSAAYVWESETVGREGVKKQILLPAIATGEWDVMTWGMFTNDDIQDFVNWIEACLEHNKDMVFYLQDGWPTFRGDITKLPPDEALKDQEDDYADKMILFQTPFDALEERYPGKVHFIPAGAAVVRMLQLHFEQKLPGFDTVSEHLGGTKGIYREGFHLSNDSGMGQLMGYLYYGMLYKRSAQLIEDYQPAGIAPELDAILREVAWKAIVGSPFSGLTDKDENGIADENG